MRKIESMIINAIQNRENFKSGERDKIHYSSDNNTLTVKLWNHQTAKIRYETHEIFMSDCGFATQTTMSRLNCVTAALSIPVTFRIKNDCTSVYINGKLTEEKKFTCNGWTVYIY